MMNKKEIIKKEQKNFIIGIMIIVFLTLVTSLSVHAQGRDNESLRAELQNLTSSLTKEGYGWLINYSLEDYAKADIEIYKENGEEVIATINNISDEMMYKTYLNGSSGVGLNETESYKTFDLKIMINNVIGVTEIIWGVVFDWIVDPTYAIGNFTTSESIDTNVTQENNFSHLAISDVAPYNSLVAYYPFDVTKSGATWNDSQINNGLVFDGIDDYVDVRDDVSLQFGINNISMSAWVKTTKSGLAFIYYKNSGVNGLQWYLNNGKQVFAIAGGASATSDTILNDGNWHHISFEANRGKNLTFYLDGSFDGTSNISGSSGTDVSESGINAKLGSDGTYFFNGSIDEVMIFNRSLTATEISDLYNNQSTGLRTLEDDTSLVSYWYLDETGGISVDDSKDRNDGVAMGYADTNVYDYSKNNNDGVAYNQAHQVDSIYGKAFEFDGDKDYVSVGNSGSLNITKALTLLLWVKFDDLKNDDGGLISKSADVSKYFSTAEQKAYEIGILDDTLWFQISNGTDVDSISISSTSLEDGTWHQIAATWNGSAGTNNQIVYFDAVPIYVDNTTIDSIQGINSLLDIGGYTSAFSFNGSIDEVMIFNTSLTAQQILDIYNNQSGRFKTPGTSELKQFNITAGNNTVNVTTDNFQENFGSSLELRLGEWDVSLGYNDSVDGDTYDLSDGLVGYWHFDNISGYENDTHVFDWSGNGNNGTANGDASPVSDGVYDGAFEFDGDGDYVDINGLTDISNNTWTVSVWFNTDNTTEQSIIYGYVSSGSDERIRLYISSSGIFSFIDDYGNVLNSGFVSSLNTWYHGVVVYDYPNQNVSIYLNGEYKNSDTSFNQAPSELGLLQIGRQAVYDLNGSIDEVMIYNRSLSASEIEELYIKGRAKWDYSPYKPANETNQTYVISSDSTNILPEYKFNAGNNTDPFYSPLLEAGMSFSYFEHTFPNISYAGGTREDYNSTTDTNVYINVTTEDDANIRNLSYNLYNSTLNTTGLVGYWSFDFNNSDGSYFDSSGEGNTGTANGNMFVNSSGKLNGAGQFDGDGDYVDVGTVNLNANDNISMFGWAKPINVGGGAQHPLFDIGGSIAAQFYKEGGSSNLILVVYLGSYKCLKGTAITASNAFTDNQWSYIGYTRDANFSGGYSNYTIYVDGVAKASDLCNGTLSYLGKLGSYLDGSLEYWNGSIDEVMIFNRSLSADEIAALYQRGAVNRTVYGNKTTNINITGLGVNDYHYFADVWTDLDEYATTGIRNTNITSAVSDNPPVSILSLPANNSNYTNGTIVTFEINATDDNNLVNVTLYVWNEDTSLNHTNTTVFNGTSNSTTFVKNFTYNFTVDGNYLWNGYVCDNAATTQCDWAVNWTLNISGLYPDVTAPNVSVNTPLNQSYNTNTIVFNVTAVDETGMSGCEYSLNSGVDNFTMSNSSSSWNATNSSMVQGSITVSYYCNDTSWNINDSESVVLFVDSVNPTWSGNKTNLTAGTVLSNQVYFNITLNESNPGVYVFSWYNGSDWVNDSVSSYSDGGEVEVLKTINIDVGNINWTWYVNDSSGNLNQSDEWSVTLTADDATPPVVSLVSPANNTGDSDGNLSFVFNVSDAGSVDNCSLIFNGVLNQTNTSISKNVNTSFNITGLSSGNYNWSVNCSDDAGNVGGSANWVVGVVLMNKFAGKSTDLSSVNLSNISNLAIEDVESGLINFSEDVDLSNGINVNSFVNISFNRIEINSSRVSELNKSARLSLYNLTFSNPQVLKDGVVCSDCTEVSYSGVSSGGIFVFDVNGFSVYSAGETPSSGVSEGTGGSSPRGGRIDLIPECVINSDCEKNQHCVWFRCYDNKCSSDSDCNLGESEVCLDSKCVKLFDVKIMKIDSPIMPEQLFNFTYLMKGMADIKGDVVVSFWLEKDNKTVTSGSDTIYLGSFEEKVETTSLFLPVDTSIGNYDFYVQVNLEGHKTRAHRIVQVGIEEVLEPIIEAETSARNYDIYIIFGLVGFAFFVLFIVVCVVWLIIRKIKLRIVEDEKEAVEKEKRFRKSKIAVGLLGLFVVLGGLVYYLNRKGVSSLLIEKVSAKVYLWVSAAILWSRVNVVPFVKNLWRIVSPYLSKSHPYFYYIVGSVVGLFVLMMLGIIIIMWGRKRKERENGKLVKRRL